MYGLSEQGECMNDISDKPWAWAVPILYSVQNTLQEHGVVPTTAFFYFAPGADPLGMNVRDQATLTQIDGVNLTSPEATYQSIALLQQHAFEDAPDAVMMIGEGWDFSEDAEAMERARNGEDVQPSIVRPCIFFSIETPSAYYLSQAELLTDKHGFKTFVPQSLLLFEEVPNDKLNGRFARILSANKLTF
jgi:hypothetical protein